MKNLIVGLLLSTSGLIFAQAHPERIKDYSTNLFGLAYHNSSEVNQSYYDTILNPVYKDVVEINNSFLLIKTETKKIGKATFTKDLELVELNGKELKVTKAFEFGQYWYHDKLILENKGGQFSLYDPFQEKYLIENFSSCRRISECSKCDVFFSVIANDKAGVYTRNGELLFETKEAAHINYSSSLKLFVQGEKLSTYYNSKGEVVFKEVTDVQNLCPRITSKRYYQVSCKNKTTNLYANGKIILSDFKGSFLSEMQNLNRIIAVTAEGYVVYDSTGNRVNNEVYEFLYPAVKNKDEANLVQQSGKWKFVDKDYKPLSNESFYHAEVLSKLFWTDNFYTVQRNKAEKGLFVYNKYGKPISNDSYSSVEYDYYYKEDVLLEKEGLWVICRGNQIGEFKYASVQIIEELMASPFYKCQLPGKPGQIVLYDNYRQHEYFSDWKVTDIKPIDGQFEERWILLVYGENGKFQLVNMAQTSPDKISKSGAFEFEDHYFDEDIGYDYNILFVQKNNLWGIYRTDTLVEAIPCKFDKIYWDDYYFQEFELLKVEKNGKLGLLSNYKGEYKEMAAPIYDKIEILEDAIVVKQGKKYGILNIYDGSIMAPPIFTEEPSYDMIFSDELYFRQPAVQDNIEKECFLLNAYGEKAQLVCYENLQAVDQVDVWTFEEKGNIGVINNQLDTLLSPVFDGVTPTFEQDGWKTEINGKKGLRTWEGAVILKEEYDDLEIDRNNFSEIILLKKGEKWAAYLSEELQTDFEYEAIELTADYVLALKDGKWGALTFSLSPFLDFNYNSKEELMKAISEE